MIWIAPTEKDTATDSLGKCLWLAADQFYTPQSNGIWKLAQMNLAIRGIDANRGANSHDENFHNLQWLLFQ